MDPSSLYSIKSPPTTPQSQPSNKAASRSNGILPDKMGPFLSLSSFPNAIPSQANGEISSLRHPYQTIPSPKEMRNWLVLEVPEAHAIRKRPRKFPGGGKVTHLKIPR